MKLGLVGGGFMGEAMVRAVLRAGLAAPADIVVCEQIPDRRQFLAQQHGVNVTAELGDVAAGEGLLVLAVKPQDCGSLAPLGRALPPERTVVSIMAGVRLDTVRELLHHERVARVMPNTPAAIGAGVSVWTADPSVPEADRERIQGLLEAMGRQVYVADEKYLDMATAVSGSGPGYVYLLVEAFIDAAVALGFARDVASVLAIYTFLGSARYLEETGKHPAIARNEVTSPGGTTAAGLFELESAGVRAAFVRAVSAAYLRARELGAEPPSKP